VVEATLAVMRRTPYQGLMPYTEADSDWFFGREEWCEVIGDHLRAYRITVLYGTSGVGKSSVLRAGPLRRLTDEARGNVAEFGAPRLLPVVFSAWSLDDPLTALQEAVAAAAGGVAPALAGEPPEGPLADVLEAWPERIEGPLLLVLDQFEEFFLYHDRPDDSALDGVAAALRRRNPAIHFLLSIREDSLAKLDRFKGHVPGLLDHLLRIDHLDRDAARQAIVRPLDLWNELLATPGEEVEALDRSGSNHERIAIEAPLIQRVLEAVQTDRVFIGQMGHGVTGAAAETGSGSIEAPYLQLVMTRLWEEERGAHSSSLRLTTLESLGGVKSIVETHLDQTMNLLTADDRDVAARVFHYLVTPSGTKIAHSAADLAKYAGVDEQELAPVLAQLATPKIRVLRLVPPPHIDGAGRYEIFHDVLGAAVLDWRGRHIRGRSVRYGAAWVWAVIAQALLFFLPLLFVIAGAGAGGAGLIVFDVWAGFGFLWWSLATVILFRHRRRRARRIWVIPVYEALAIVLGPIALVPLARRGLRRRLWAAAV
jgi:Novel STAND NTPase 1